MSACCALTYEGISLWESVSRSSCSANDRLLMVGEI